MQTINRQTIKRVFLKLSAALAILVASMLLFRYLLLPAIETIFHPGESATSAIRRTGMFLFALLGYWTYVHFCEKRAATELRWAPVAIGVAAVAGALLISIAILSLFALGSYEMTGYRGPQHGLLGVAGVILIAAFIEEVVYRGILFHILEDAWGSSIALWSQALVFGAMHLANVEANFSDWLTTGLSVTLLGVFWGCVYVRTRNLWAAAANHAAWNFTIVLSGVPLSGIEEWRALAPIESRYNGPPWLTGGAFGPENSILTIVLMSFILIVLLRRTRHRFTAGGAIRSSA